MKFNKDTMVIDASDINHLITVCMRQYLYQNKNKSPAKIIVEQISSFDFRYDAASKAEHIPVEFTASSISATKQKETNDNTDRNSRARGNSTAAQPISTDSSSQPEPDEQE